MGKKKTEPEAEPKKEEVEAAPEDPPIIKETQILTNVAAADGEEVKASGTPALRGFWKEAMKHLPALEEHIEEWDEPVLDYCKDITKAWLDEADPLYKAEVQGGLVALAMTASNLQDISKGFKLIFHFVENPYFMNAELWKDEELEYHVEEASPYTGEVSAKEIKAAEIDWIAGKNVTVEKVTKKVKGGGAKKAKQKGKDLTKRAMQAKPPMGLTVWQEKEEPRDSFFRGFFRNLKEGMPIPDDVNLEDARGLMDDDDDDDDQMMELLLENDYEIGCCVRDQLIPFAVRWYTGEAAPEDHGFDEDEEEDEDEDEDDDDEDDDEDEDERPKKGFKPPARKGKKDGPPGEDRQHLGTRPRRSASSSRTSLSEAVWPYLPREPARLLLKQRGSALQEASAKARRQAVAILRFWKLQAQVEIARRSRRRAARLPEPAECRAAILSCRGRILTQLCIMAWRLFHRALQMRSEAEALRQWGRSEAG
eukprot:s1820_g5.t1